MQIAISKREKERGGREKEESREPTRKIIRIINLRLSMLS